MGISKCGPQAVCCEAVGVQELWVWVYISMQRYRSIFSDKRVPKGRGVTWWGGGELCMYMCVHVSLTTSM